MLEAELGSGATAVVWRSTDTLLGVKRAIKVLSRRAAQSGPLRRRLLSEARAMARLEHPNILRVFDVSTDEQALDGDQDFVVMALAPQGSLADWIDAHGPMPADLAIVHLIGVLSALHLAHNSGVVHRDVKPQNILLGDDGTALLADFGIALLAEDQLRATRTGVAMGSLAFMAPEQRLDARSVTAAADLYAVGTTLYNLLTAANPVDLFAADASSPRWAGIPADVAAAIRRAVAYAPGDRFPDARAMALHLRALLPEASRIPLDPPPPSRRLPGFEDTERVHTGPRPDADLRPPANSVEVAFTFLGDELPDTTGSGGIRPPPPLVPAAPPPPASAAPSPPPPRRLPWRVPVVLLVGGAGLAALWLRGGPTLVEVPAEEAPAEEVPPAEVPPAEIPVAEVPVAEIPPAEVPVAEDPDAETTAVKVPVAEASVTKASRPEAPPEAPPPPAAEGPAGTWVGNAHANSVRLELAPAAGGWAGRLTTTNAITGGRVTLRVTAVQEADLLVISEDLDPAANPDAGRYLLRLSDDGQHLVGRFEALQGSRSFHVDLRREAP